MDKSDVNGFRQQLAKAGYIAEHSLSLSLILMKELGRPLLLEGEAGVGKTAVGKALANVFACPLIRLQCYEGLDISSAIYEWNYQHQLLAIKLLEQSDFNLESADKQIFSDKYLLKRPLLKAITQSKPPVLLIDEVDRADEEFEAYLLEVLSDFQISVPELGTLTATSKPYVILTSNSTRELSDALRRRCLYHYVDYPDFNRELSIISAHLPNIKEKLARQVVSFVQSLRQVDLVKNPGIAETLDWIASLIYLNITSLDDDINAIKDSLVCLLKTQQDRDALDDVVVERLVAEAV